MSEMDFNSVARLQMVNKLKFTMITKYSTVHITQLNLISEFTRTDLPNDLSLDNYKNIWSDLPSDKCIKILAQIYPQIHLNIYKKIYFN